MEKIGCRNDESVWRQAVALGLAWLYSEREN
jgi:hypothetical protein